MPRPAKKKKIVKAKKSVKPKVKGKALKKITAKTKPVKKPKAITKVELSIGGKAPDFSLPATKLGKVSLSMLKGKPFVLYFYPKDDTPGCTAQACDFRDSAAPFNKLGATVIGVSKDSIKSHEKFAKKFDLAFPLASDEASKVCEEYGVWVEKSMYGRNYMGVERTTVLVDGKGVIRSVWRKVSVPGHVDQVRAALQAL